MKKSLVIITSLVLVICLAVGLFVPVRESKEGYLRIHIRANSNLEVDQNVKYKVKEAVVNFLTPVVSNCKSANEAMKVVNNNLENISEVATNVLSAQGFNYKAKAVLKDEYFPTRNYGDLVLEDGYYDALIVNLGDGKGENWWCVVYPPLCFLGEGEGNVVYKSLFKEIIEKIKNK